VELADLVLAGGGAVSGSVPVGVARAAARRPPAWWVARPLLRFVVLGAALVGVRELAAPAEAPTATPLAIRVDAAASDGDIRQRADEAILVEEGLRLGWALTDPVIRDRLVRNMRFVGEVGDEVALLDRALAMGMERTDPVVRQRLAYRAEQLMERTADLEVPTDAELAAHRDAHPDRFERPARVRFDQIYLSRDRRAAALDSQALELARALADRPDQALDPRLGDPLATARPGRSATRSELTRDYGQPFAAAVFAAPVGQLVGPIPSPLGLHLVRVRARAEATTPTVDAIRPALTASWRHDRRAAARRHHLAQLRARYAVAVERVSAAPSAP
jgi:peptidyl-prolyl cis-trans isomerase C